MKWISRIFCQIIALCLFFILLINSIDYAVYYRPEFYEKTFTKYNVSDYAQMELSEILNVSNYLIQYLKGNEESLKDFEATVDGNKRTFYSERELLHMNDVKKLFGYGIALRKICLIITILLVFIMLIKKWNFTLCLARYIIRTFLVLLGILGHFALIVSQNFNRAFLMFHHLFFDNDLWILDPDKDWIIRLLPEKFFLDMAFVILIVFSISLFIILALCILYLIVYRRRRSISNSNILPLNTSR